MTDAQTQTENTDVPTGHVGFQRLNRMDEIADARRKAVAEEAEVPLEDVLSSTSPIPVMADTKDPERDDEEAASAAGDGADTGAEGLDASEPESDDSEEAGAAAAAQEGEKAQAEESEAQTLEHILSAEEEGDTLITVKINGVEETVSVAKAKRVFQKESAASRKLEDANRREQALDEREERLRKREEALANESATPAQETAQPTAEDIAAYDAKKREFTDAIYSGDDKAGDLLDELIDLRVSSRTAPAPAEEGGEAGEGGAPINRDELKAEIKGEMKQEEALAKFAKDYRDIATDPDLASIADRFLAEELRNDELSFSKALSNAGDRTREWLAEKTGVESKHGNEQEETTDTSASGFDEKKAKKAEADAPPEGAEGSSTSQHEEEKPQTTSDVIADMAKGRGKPLHY